jgi:hypothetical protein
MCFDSVSHVWFVLGLPRSLLAQSWESRWTRRFQLLRDFAFPSPGLRPLCPCLALRDCICRPNKHNPPSSVAADPLVLLLPAPPTDFEYCTQSRRAEVEPCSSHRSSAPSYLHPTEQPFLCMACQPPRGWRPSNMRPSGEAFHRCGSVLARPASLTTMAITSTDATLKPLGQACWWTAPLARCNWW